MRWKGGEQTDHTTHSAIGRHPTTPGDVDFAPFSRRHCEIQAKGRGGKQYIYFQLSASLSIPPSLLWMTLSGDNGNSGGNIASIGLMGKRQYGNNRYRQFSIELYISSRKFNRIRQRRRHICHILRIIFHGNRSTYHFMQQISFDSCTYSFLSRRFM